MLARDLCSLLSCVAIDWVRFYYADERKPDGSPGGVNIDGEAHGKLYAELADTQSQGEWQQTFVKGEGYKKF